MKKLLALALITTSSFIFSACSLFPSSNLPQQTDSPKTQALKMSQLIASGASAKCTITDTQNPDFITTMIFDGQKMKMTGTQVAEGGAGSFINDGEYTYVWQEGQSIGYKNKNMTEDEVEEMSSQITDSPTNPQDYPEYTTYENNPTYQIDCQQINISPDEFNPPSDIQFIDPSQMDFSDLQNLDFSGE